MYLGVDIGGTFTDLVLMDDEGAISTAKSPTTTGDLALGVFDAIELAATAKGLSAADLLRQVVAFGHGTTQATNALIERTGAVTGLITTRGFGDTLGLQRLMGFTAGMSVDQLGWYSKRRYPVPIIPRELRQEVAERVDCTGSILLPLDEAAVRAAVDDLSVRGVETFAVAFLWSFRNPTHERRVGEIIREMRPDAYVSLSSEIAPIIGEYERTATTALNSYLAPKVVTYLERMEDRLQKRGFNGSFHILNSSGGVMPAKEAARKPVLLLTSGPTGGVLGSLQLANALGHRNVITTDMGGTSFDVGLIVEGRPVVSPKQEAGGYHLNTPMIDIRAIGAGGGSIARVENGLLRVGPDSAGASPGPVCYSRGGKLVTVTDADVVLGIISQDNFLGGRMPADRLAATEAIREQIANPLGLSVEAAAAGIRQVVDAHMADILREVTVGRGYDPRDFVLYAYGGAGPAHCAAYGADLGVPKIIVPATSMAHSAYGALASEIHQSAERSLLMRGGGGGREPADGLDVASIDAVYSELEALCAQRMQASGVEPSTAHFARTVDMRYRRQTHDLIIRFSSGPVTVESIREAVNRFEEVYESLYGRGSGFRQAGVELTTFRVEAVGGGRKPAPSRIGSDVRPMVTLREVYDSVLSKWAPTSIWRWLDLPVGHRVGGPAVIEHPETTVYIGPRQTAVVDVTGNLTIDLIEVHQ
ncbi:MAG: hydantoinase/oxoprolinase family protein [Hyphomicrobiales bacterium]|nr:hydantoinase/oxoprolinase family protein [Hyphomicrobiales bacterium]